MFKHVFIYLALLLLICASTATADEEKIEVGDLPAKVAAKVKQRFPDATILGAEKEEEDGKTVFEVQLRDNKSKIDMSLSAEGEIIEIEKQLREADLPDAVRKTLADEYSDKTVKMVEEVIVMKDGKEVVEGYELKFAAVGKKTLEVKIAPNGKVKKSEEEDADDEGEEESES